MSRVFLQDPGSLLQTISLPFYQIVEFTTNLLTIQDLLHLKILEDLKVRLRAVEEKLVMTRGLK